MKHFIFKLLFKRDLNIDLKEKIKKLETKIKKLQKENAKLKEENRDLEMENYGIQEILSNYD